MYLGDWLVMENQKRPHFSWWKLMVGISTEWGFLINLEKSHIVPS